jgi:hypothetical protein
MSPSETPWVGEIARQFRSDADVEGIPAALVFTAGIQRLCAEGLIELAAEPGKAPEDMRASLVAR